MKKLYIAIILLACVLAGAAIGYALTQWLGTINWTGETKQFSVWDQPTDGSEITSPYTDDIGVIPFPDGYVYSFYLQNDGTIQITIIITETAETGCSGTWDQPSYILTVGSTRVLAELTLDITDEGSYSWDFTISP